MRALTFSAVLALLAAGPALAGDPRGGGHHRPPPGPPPAPCCDHGGGSRNVNINVNASARAFAEASATSHFNARTYEVGGIRGRGHGGTVYVGGGYGGDAGYGYVGAPVYYDIDRRVLACASAPFGYVVTGFGRDSRRPPSCGGRYEYAYEDYDRGGRYGYSERHDSYEERSYESYESYEEYGAYEEGVYAGADYDRRDERRDDYREDYRDEAYAARQYDRGYMDGRRDCDCRPDGRDGEPYYAVPPPPPAPPVREPEIDTSRPYRPQPPRQEYRQEYGERG